MMLVEEYFSRALLHPTALKHKTAVGDHPAQLVITYLPTYLPTYLHLIVESVVPQMLHVLPVADDAILHLIIIVYSVSPSSS